MEVTLLGMVMDFKLLQPENALPPIDVTLLGMVMEVNSSQSQKAQSPMDVTLYLTFLYVTAFGITTLPVYLSGLSVTSACFAFVIRL